MRKLVITLVVLAVVFVVVDRVTHAAAQQQVAREVAVASNLSSPPDVRIRGFPFLTQAVRGHYRRIDLTTRDVSVREFDIERLEVRFAGVDAPLQDLLRRDVPEVRARTVTGSVVVSFAEMQRLIPGNLEVGAKRGDLQLSGRASVFGRSVPLTATMDIATTDRAITFRPTRIEVGGRVGGSFLRDRLTFRVPLGDLPMQLRPTGVRVTNDGVRISARAEDVSLSRSSG